MVTNAAIVGETYFVVVECIRMPLIILTRARRTQLEISDSCHTSTRVARPMLARPSGPTVCARRNCWKGPAGAGALLAAQVFEQTCSTFKNPKCSVSHGAEVPSYERARILARGRAQQLVHVACARQRPGQPAREPVAPKAQGYGSGCTC